METSFNSMAYLQINRFSLNSRRNSWFQGKHAVIEKIGIFIHAWKDDLRMACVFIEYPFDEYNEYEKDGPNSFAGGFARPME